MVSDVFQARTTTTNFNIGFRDIKTWTHFVCTTLHITRQEVPEIKGLLEREKKDQVGSHGIYC